MTGDFLPPKLVYQGKTEHCLSEKKPVDPRFTAVKSLGQSGYMVSMNAFGQSLKLLGMVIENQE